MKYLLTSLYLTRKPFRRPGQWGDGCIVTENFRGPSARRSHHETQLPSGVQGAAQYGDGRPQMVPGKAADAPAGRVMLAVGK